MRIELHGEELCSREDRGGLDRSQFERIIRTGVGAY